MTLDEILKETAKINAVIAQIEMLKRGRSVYMAQKKSVKELVADLGNQCAQVTEKCKEYGNQ